MRQRDLGECLHPPGRRAEPGGEPPTELGHLGHHRQQDGGGTRLTFAVVLERGEGEQPGGAPGVVLGQRLLRGLRERDLLSGRTGPGAPLRLGRGPLAAVSHGSGLRCPWRGNDHLLGPVPLLGLVLGGRVLDCVLGLVLGVVVDVDAEVRRQAAQAGRVTLPDGTELPLAGTPVELAEDEGAHGARVLDGELDQAVT